MQKYCERVFEVNYELYKLIKKQKTIHKKQYN